MTKKFFRRNVLRTAMIGFVSSLVGCGQKVILPQIAPASDLPVTLTCTFNEQEAVDLTTVVEVAAGEPIRVFGTVQAKPGVAFARAEKAFALMPGFKPKPLPLPKLNWASAVDKPDHLHAIFYAAVVPFGTNPEMLGPSELGLTNQYVDPDRKSLIFSGGLLGPKRPGKYTLRLWGAFKRQREFRKNDDLNQCGEAKAIREITLIVI